MAFEKVARLDEVAAGQTRCVRIRGIEVGLFRVGEEIYAMENSCPHQGDPLHEGELEGCLITCPAHGWCFDVRTGFRPDDADGFPIPCFAVELREGEVLVDIEQPINLRRSR